jgi:hypothetical protein
MIHGVIHGVLHRSSYPAYLRHPAVRGVYIGGCIERGPGLGPRAKIHSHCVRGTYRGWICMHKLDRLYDEMLCLHELAHLIVDEPGHSARWRACVRRIGGTLNATPSMRSYHALG